MVIWIIYLISSEIKNNSPEDSLDILCLSVSLSLCVCVCVCVDMRAFQYVWLH